MSIDPALIDLAARIDRSLKRVERLETLEYETVAFPSGTGLTLICDIVLPVPAAAVTLCPAGPIPPSFAHLWLVISCTSDREVPPKLRMNLNGDFSGSYSYYVREELQSVPFPPGVGASDTEAIQPGGSGAFDGSWQICHPSATSFLAIPKPRGACMAFLPDYTDASMYSQVGWISWSQREATPFADFLDVDQGGGRYTGLAPITSILITHPAPGVFLAGSQFTLYGL